MNKTRRSNLEQLAETIGNLKDQLDNAKTDIEALKEEEEEYRDNMPENLQSSSRYEMAEERLDRLLDVLDAVDGIYD